MTTRASVPGPSGRRLAVTAIAALICLAIGVLAMPEQIRIRLAEKELLEPPCAPDARSTTCLVSRANALRKKAQYDAAVSLSRQVIAREPMHLAALEVLARSLDPRRAEEKRRLISVIGRLSKHSPYAHGALMMDAYRRDRADELLFHADVLLRWAAVTPDSVFDTVMLYLTDEAGRAAITRRLATDPPWRADFLRAVASRAPSTDALALVSTMSRMGLRQTPIEVEFLVNRLLQDNQYDTLRQLRRSQLPRASATLFVFDGGFDGLEGPASLVWQARTQAGGEAIIGTAETDHPGALLLRHDLFSSSDWMAQELILLPPGRYRLSLVAQALNDLGSRRFVIEVACRGASSLVRIPIQTGKEGWVSTRADFTIPPEACQAQWLAFAPVTGDRIEEAEILVDRVSIIPSTTPVPAPPQPVGQTDAR